MTATACTGRFVVVSLNVANIGDEPRHCFGQNQKLKDAVP
jgi:hypothetical protein